jgi:hypothetical protein
MLTLSSRSVFHIGVIQKYTLLKSIPHSDRTHCSLIVTENKWQMELITAAHCRQILKQIPMHELHCSLWNMMPSSRPQS